MFIVNPFNQATIPILVLVIVGVITVTLLEPVGMYLLFLIGIVTIFLSANYVAKQEPSAGVNLVSMLISASYTAMIYIALLVLSIRSSMFGVEQGEWPLNVLSYSVIVLLISIVVNSIVYFVKSRNPTSQD
jgi:hypothetical protein